MKLQVALSVFLATLAVGALAAEAPKVSVQAEQTPIKDVMTEVSKQVGLQVLCEPDVQGTVSGAFAAMDLEKFLDSVTAGGKIAWQKLYLPADPEKKLTLAEIKAQADAVKALSNLPIIVYDPTTKQQTVYVKEAAAASKVAPETLGLKAVYLISNVKAERPVSKAADGTTAATGEAQVDPEVIDKFQSMQMERIGMLNAMTPAQRSEVVKQEMLNEMKLDPATLAAMWQARRDARQSMTPEQQEAMRQSMRDAHRATGDTGGNRQGRGNRGNRQQQ